MKQDLDVILAKNKQENTELLSTLDQEINSLFSDLHMLIELRVKYSADNSIKEAWNQIRILLAPIGRNLGIFKK